MINFINNTMFILFMTTDILSKIKKYLTIGLITGTAIITPIKAQERLEGTITDPITQQGLEGRKITLYTWTGQEITDSIKTWTDINGFYLFDNITDVEEEQTPNNQRIIQYYGNKIFTNNFEEKTLKIYNSIGQEVKSIKTNDQNIDINLEGLASGIYLTVIEINKKAYSNLVTADAGKIIGYKKLEDHITEEKKQ
ncbi:MAG: hypothetical protein KatS3mg002_0761 [Candidatus Woesearchaeota archaeon]|nr:MAG: hypothetical protein KatS3mg002_0761 [Candidatus Woesearchaeota archaeon]